MCMYIIAVGLSVSPAQLMNTHTQWLIPLKHTTQRSNECTVPRNYSNAFLADNAINPITRAPRNFLKNHNSCTNSSSDVVIRWFIGGKQIWIYTFMYVKKYMYTKLCSTAHTASCIAVTTGNHTQYCNNKILPMTWIVYKTMTMQLQYLK